ncbi:V4R domain-containing protein [Chloroflexota bacterium]
MGEKVMVDFPGFITRDKSNRHLLVGDDSHVLLSNTIIADLHRQLFDSLGFDEAARLVYATTKKGTLEVQSNLIRAYRVTLKGADDLENRISRFPLYIQTFGHGKGKTIERGKEFVFEVKDSSIAEYLKDSQLGRPVCYFLCGFFAGMAEAYAALVEPAAHYDCVETKCIAAGAPNCEFKLSPS